jgi:ABC-2 type transport system permease protein
MNIQTSASFRKELLAFFRTKKFLIIFIVIIGWAILGPLLIRGMGVFLDALSPVYDDFGVDVAGMTDFLGSAASTGVMSAVSDLTTTGLIVFLLLINSFAGGEQKKRSIMIPKSSGLRSFGYIFPKFIIYPLTAFILAIAGAFVAWGISSLVFTINDVSPEGVLLAGALAGVCLMFYVCCHIALGTSTGQAGMSAAICIVASLLLPNIFALLGSEYVYNPFTLNILAGSVVQEGALLLIQPYEIIMTVLIAFAIMVIVYFIALFVQNAKKIDNSGNEIRL